MLQSGSAPARRLSQSQSSLENFLKTATQADLVERVRSLTLDLKKAESTAYSCNVENASLAIRVRQLEATLKQYEEERSIYLSNMSVLTTAPVAAAATSPAATNTSGIAEESTIEPAAGSDEKMQTILRKAISFRRGPKKTAAAAAAAAAAATDTEPDSEPEPPRRQRSLPQVPPGTIPTGKPPRPSTNGGSKERARTSSLGAAELIKKRNEKQMLSSDLEERVQLAAARKYTAEAHQAARIIQLAYRRYRMNQNFKKLRGHVLNNVMKQEPSRRSEEQEKMLSRRLSLTKPLETMNSPDISFQGVILEGCEPSTPVPVSSTSCLERGKSSISVLSSTSELSETDLERIKRIGIHHFNRNPRKGVEWLIKYGIIGETQEAIAEFFHNERGGISRQMIGEYLGYVCDDFHSGVLLKYVSMFDLSDMGFDQALRYFLASFRLPGEAQKISRILEVFAEKYHNSNPGLFNSGDTLFVLAFSVVMLNTDAHNAANKNKMTKEQFIKNNRGIDGGNDIPRPYLEEIYDRIVAEPFRNLGDNTTVLERISEDIIQKDGKLENLVAPYRQFIRRCDIYEIEDIDKANSKHKHARTVFLFSDKLVITKPTKAGNNKFVYKKCYPLLGMMLVCENSPHHALPVYTLLSQVDDTVLSFCIDPESRGAKYFEDDIKEMISLCEAIEAERILSSQGTDLDVHSFNKQLSRNSFGGSLGDLRRRQNRQSTLSESSSTSSLARKGTLLKAKGVMHRMLHKGKRPSDKSLNASMA